MRIVNRTQVEIAYELKGGPLRMTLSRCDLLPGEEEVWSSPYRTQQIDVRCEVHVIAGEHELVTTANDDDVVTVVEADGGYGLRVGR